MDQNSFATTLLTLFIDIYGTAGFEWAPETILKEINDDHAVKLPGINFDKLMAAIYIITCNSFYKSLPDFIELSNILANHPSTHGTFSPSSVEDTAWGLTEAMLLAPPDDDDQNPFSEEIIGYIEYVCHEEGIITPPDILRLGTRSNALAQKVQYDFSDDPEMFTSIWGMEKSRTDDINNYIKERLMLLFNQLKSLPLENGYAGDLVKKMIMKLEEQGSPTVSNSVL